jgi:hypothetical protein
LVTFTLDWLPKVKAPDPKLPAVEPLSVMVDRDPFAAFVKEAVPVTGPGPEAPSTPASNPVKIPPQVMLPVYEPLDVWACKRTSLLK